MQKNTRPPVVVIMGHIDHGKSTLLDTIRNTNIVAKEAGGITQHLSAYSVQHSSEEHGERAITFLDTPGHAAFQSMRMRGADVADIAVLIVAADDGVMPQTLEALKAIEEAGIPYIVAVNKTDKPHADLPRTQASLIENGIFIEGMGGDIPWVPISAKSGTGINELLDTIILVAELAELTADPSATATGSVIEGHLDKRRGTAATLIIKNGTLTAGGFVVSEHSYAPVRIMEDCHGKNIKTAGPSEPVGIVGWSDVPRAGAPFFTVSTKKEAERAVLDFKEAQEKSIDIIDAGEKRVIPILIKTDTLGSIDAVKHELMKHENDRVHLRIIDATVGDITATDVQTISATEGAVVVGFNVGIERTAQELAERLSVAVASFRIIYELAEWIEGVIKVRTPTRTEEIVTGSAKLLKYFSSQKGIHLFGATMRDGSFKTGARVRIMRRDSMIGDGTIVGMQQNKVPATEVSGGEFGMQLTTKIEAAPGDEIIAVETRET